MQFLSLSSTDPALNLALEECLLQWLPADHPGLFLLWQNAPSVIVGRHQVTLDEIDADFVRRRGLPVVRRMTGGGAVYHDLGNLNFSFMENAHGRKTVDFARYLRPVCAALAELGVQAPLTGRNDLEAGGRKISGSAQSLRQGRILHHGTLLVSLDFGELVQALHVDPDKIRSKGIASVRSRVANISEFWTPGSGMEDLRAALLRHCADGEADDATMEFVQQVLAGKVNKDLVAKLRGRGVGLCGMDGQMLRCTELDPALGHVGEIIHVDPTLISTLLDGGYIPVIATVGMDDLGQAYNVNADTAAAQIAIALKAEKLVSMTDIAGLLRDKDDETTLIPEVEVSEIEGYKAAGIIAGGMIPKIGGMADAIYQGVHEAVIIDGRVPHSILLELFSNRGSGTRFYRRSHQE